MRSLEITTPERAAAEYIALYTGLLEAQQEALRTATAIACQALLEAGPEASSEEVYELAMSATMPGDPELIFIPGQVMQAVDGEFGIMINDNAWRERATRMRTTSELFTRLITTKQGDNE